MSRSTAAASAALSCCALWLLSLEKSETSRMEPGQNGLSALETDRVESSMHPDAPLGNRNIDSLAQVPQPPPQR